MKVFFVCQKGYVGYFQKPEQWFKEWFEESSRFVYRGNGCWCACQWFCELCSFEGGVGGTEGGGRSADARRRRGGWEMRTKKGEGGRRKMGGRRKGKRE